MSATDQLSKPAVVVAEITQADGRKLFVTPRAKGGVTLSTRVRLGDGPQVMTLAVLDAAAAAALADALTPPGELSLRDQLEICRRSSKLLARTAVEFSHSSPAEPAEEPLVEIGQGDYTRRIMPS